MNKIPYMWFMIAVIAAFCGLFDGDTWKSIMFWMGVAYGSWLMGCIFERWLKV
jgi:hypothetical protein